MVLDLHMTSWVFAPGHKVRLSLSNAMWPMIWPTPHLATALVQLGSAGTVLVLPVIPAESRPASAGAAPEFPVPGPAAHPDGVRSWGDILPTRWNVSRDGAGTATAWWRGTSGTEFSWGNVVDEEYLTYQVSDADPAHAAARGEARTEIQLADRLLVFSSVLELDSDETSLRYRYRRELRKDATLVRERSWERRFPRNGQ
jgi:hypothetical protein